MILYHFILYIIQLGANEKNKPRTFIKKKLHVLLPKNKIFIQMIFFNFKKIIYN
jgi:hypothetical protein